MPSDHRQLLRDAIEASGLSARGFWRRYLAEPCECCGHVPAKSVRTVWRWLASAEPIELPDAVVRVCESEMEADEIRRLQRPG